MDNGSDDGSGEMAMAFEGDNVQVFHCADRSLAEALNIGFRSFLDREDLDYVGWIHPDHTFEWQDWLRNLGLVQRMDERPDYAKLGAREGSIAVLSDALGGDRSSAQRHGA